MHKKTILVVGFARQTQTAKRIRFLHEQGAKVINIDPYGVEGRYGSISWQDGKISWKGHDISPKNIDAVLVTALASETPPRCAFEKANGKALGWADWFQHFGLQRDRSDTLLGLLLAYEQAGVPLFNPPSQSNLSRRKPYQISVMQGVGCNMPKTLVTNNPERAEAFIRANGDCIIKPAAGGSLTLSANELMMHGQLDKLVEAPAIIQQRIFGADLRIMLVDGKVCSAAEIRVPEGTLDFRGDDVYQSGQIRYREVQLPEQVQAQCRAAAMQLGLRFCGIDIKHTMDNEYFLLECNSSPIYLDVENKLGHPITQRLCEALLKAQA